MEAQIQIGALPQDQKSDPPKRILWKWSLLVCACLLVYGMWQCGSALFAGAKLADAAVQRFHSELNSGDFEQICSEADPDFSKSDKHDELIGFLQGIHKKLGNATSEKRLNLNVRSTTNGTFISADFSSQYDSGSATETFVWRKSSGTLKLYNYNVQSKALLK